MNIYFQGTVLGPDLEIKSVIKIVSILRKLRFSKSYLKAGETEGEGKALGSCPLSFMLSIRFNPFLQITMIAEQVINFY